MIPRQPNSHAFIVGPPGEDRMDFYIGRDPMSQTSRQASKKYFSGKQARKIAENFFSGDERNNCPHIASIGLI